ncbi:MAG: hypothetical protein VX681_15345 [Myxococcota bacterium]|nr:hypothetical protein [Myxococcota bacterium]
MKPHWPLCAWLALLALSAAVADSEAASSDPASSDPASFVWVDEHGLTHLTDDPGGVPDAVRGETGLATRDRLDALWDDGVAGPPLTTPPGSSGSDDDRVVRLLGGVRADLARGEQARAAATLRSLLRLDPARPEPHWYLAHLDQQRGRYASARGHLLEYLSRAGAERDGPFRAAARARLARLDEEEALADTQRERGPLRLIEYTGENFRLELDAELEIRPEFADTVIKYLEGAHSDVAQQLGVVPEEPLGVVFYGRASYLRAHQKRFSFQTVGFFDGRIHVSSPADPGEPLRALLYHEYAHALYREQTGGDRPYWLNEGLAELAERRAKRVPASTRSERASLRTRIAGRDWIPLRRIAPSFGGLQGEDARAAYLESIVAAGWIEERTDVAARAGLLRRLGQGWSIDQALHEALGVDTEGLDAAIQRRLLDEFPTIAP